MGQVHRIISLTSCSAAHVCELSERVHGLWRGCIAMMTLSNGANIVSSVEKKINVYVPGMCVQALGQVRKRQITLCLPYISSTRCTACQQQLFLTPTA